MAMKTEAKTYQIIFVTLVLLAIPYSGNAAQWAKSYGVHGSSLDEVYAIQETDDGGFIAAGETGLNGYDLSVLKLDSNGSVQWQKAYKGSIYVDHAHSIRQTADGGYIVAGEIGYYSSVYDADAWVLKLDSSGNVQWQKQYGGGADDFTSSIQQTTDGGYIVSGYTYSFGAGGADVWILKLDSSGSVQWQKTYGTAGNEWSYSAQQTIDGGYVVGAMLYGDAAVIKLDSGGNIEWQKYYLGLDETESIQQTTDGGFIVACEFWVAGKKEGMVLKLDGNGSIQWQKAYGGSDDDEIYAIQQTADGGYIMAGETKSFGDTDGDVWVLKLDNYGNVAWQKRISGSDYWEYARDIQQTTDGNYILAGYLTTWGSAYQDFWVLKLDSSGHIPGTDFITDTSATVTETSAIAKVGSFVVTSTSAAVNDTTAVPNTTSTDMGVQAYTTDWVPMASPTSEDLNGVWGITATYFYAVGNNGTVLDYDGVDWAEQYLGTNTDFNGIWGSSTSDVFVVGDGGTIYHYTTTWATQTSNTTNNLNGIWGSSSSDVFAVGDAGTVVKYNGSTWSKSTPTTENLNGIWGYDANNIYAVGDGGTIIEYNGSSWNTVSHPPTENLNAIWGADNGTVTHIYAVGDSGTILHTVNGTTWELVDVPTVSNLNGIWGSKPSNIFVVGDEGTILYFGGQQWIEMDSGIMDDLKCPFGIANPHVFVVGFAGHIGLLQGPYLYGTICDSCTGDPLTGITVTWNNGPPNGGSFITTKEVYDKFGIGGGYHTLRFNKTSYQQVNDTIALPPNKIDVDHRTYLMPTTYGQYSGCVSGVVAKDIVIDGSYPDGVVTKGVKEPRINVKLYKAGGCGDVEVENVYTNQNGHYLFPTITKPGLYTLRMLNPDPQHCTVQTYDTVYHQLQDQDSFSVLIPQLAPYRYDFKLECEEGLVE